MLIIKEQSKFKRNFKNLGEEDKQDVRYCVAQIASEWSDHVIRSFRIKRPQKVKHIRPPVFEASPNMRCRMTFQIDDGALVLRNVGSDHDEVLKNP